MTRPETTEPTVLVDRVLAAAVEAGASDVYWVPARDTLAVSYGAHGAERPVATLSRACGEICVTRLKVLAGMLTYRTQVAQDGVIRGHAAAPDVEFRVASLPTVYGERVTLRLLRRDRGPQVLADLGYPAAVLDRLRGLLARPWGLLVLTGPTGSGKTTTIYAMVRELLRAGHDPATLFTIEDPVECAIDGISQVQVTRAGEEWDCATALRAVLRHDVKTLVIGEMRDREVVRVALDAALTGHRVISTYHAGDIASVYARLLHQGFEPFLVAAAVTGVVSQRLVARRDAAGVVPVAAVLEATDPWREFVLTNPGLGDLRKHLATLAGADLRAVAADLAAAGLIADREVHLL